MFRTFAAAKTSLVLAVADAAPVLTVRAAIAETGTASSRDSMVWGAAPLCQEAAANSSDASMVWG